MRQFKRTQGEIGKEKKINFKRLYIHYYILVVQYWYFLSQSVSGLMYVIFICSLCGGVSVTL